MPAIMPRSWSMMQHRLIVHAEPVSDYNDRNQFARQIKQANQILEKPCQTACADAGYANTNELEQIDSQGIQVIVPSQQQVQREEEGPFSKSHFTYDPEQDCYYCPEGNRLIYRSFYSKKRQTHLQDRTGKSVPELLKFWAMHPFTEKAATLFALRNEEVKQRLEAKYQQPDSQEIYKRRKASVEHPFGHIKRNLGVTAFLLRGMAGVRAEAIGACHLFQSAQDNKYLWGRSFDTNPENNNDINEDL